MLHRETIYPEVIRYSDNEEQMELKMKINKISKWQHLVQDLVYRKKISLMDYMKFMSILYKKNFEYEMELNSYLPF